jgi:hypothetical protein
MITHLRAESQSEADKGAYQPPVDTPAKYASVDLPRAPCFNDFSKRLCRKFFQKALP